VRFFLHKREPAVADQPRPEHGDTETQEEEPKDRLRRHMPAHRPRGRWAEEDIEHGLQACVIAGGNTRRAEQLLVEASYARIPRRTLRAWIANQHVARYRELQRDMRAEVAACRGDTHDALSEAYARLEWQLLDRLEGKVDEIPAGQLANSANRLAIGGAVHVDKARLFRSEPTEIRQVQSLPDLIRGINARWPGVVQVINDAETVEEEEGRDPSR
jgi:hypothetical protein